MYWCTVVTKNQQRILNHRGFSIVKSGGVNIHEFLKMNESWRYLHENEAYEEYKKWQFFILMKGICTPNYKWFCVAVNKSYVSFTCKPLRNKLILEVYLEYTLKYTWSILQALFPSILQDTSSILEVLGFYMQMSKCMLQALFPSILLSSILQVYLKYTCLKYTWSILEVYLEYTWSILGSILEVYLMYTSSISILGVYFNFGCLFFQSILQVYLKYTPSILQVYFKYTWIMQ